MGSYSNKTVLITGATGLIGNNLVDAFMRMGDVNLIALSRGMAKLEAEFHEYGGCSNFRMVQHDMSLPLAIEEPVDYIFHAAGSMEGKMVRDYPVDVINPNILGTMNCLDFLREQKKKTGRSGRMVLFSSVTVYRNNTQSDLTVTEEDTGITEALASGNAPYSQSKRLIEVIAAAYARQYGVDAVIGRFATVYGPTRIAPDTAFYEFIKKSIAGEDIVMNTPGLPRRDNIFIDDAIQAALLVGELGKAGEAYNISSNGELGNYASADEIAQMIADASDRKIGVSFKSEHACARTPGLKLDNSKLKSLGWNVSVSLMEGIRRTITAMK